MVESLSEIDEQQFSTPIRKSIKDMNTENQNQIQPALYIVATPIGNLSDTTKRAIEVFQQVDAIAAEDTRVTAKLCTHFQVQKKIFSLHEHSSKNTIQQLIGRIKAGAAVAYASDAGTPGVSDPGADLVAAAFAAGLRVVPVPGASALTALLSVSPIAVEHVHFHGFFPRKSAAESWRGYTTQQGLHIFYESPKRMQKTFSFLQEVAPEAKCLLGRELTKVYEQVVFQTVREIARALEQEIPLKGEFTFGLFLEQARNQIDWESIVREMYSAGVERKALILLGRQLGVPRNQVYSFVEDLKSGD